MEIIKVENLTKIYESGEIKYPALQNINLQIHKGSNVAVTGKSGSGKSTLLNMITGIDYPTSGKIIIKNQQINILTEKELTRWRGKNIGIIFQFFLLLPNISILDNILLPMEFVNVIPKKERKERAMHLLEITGIENHAKKFPHELSGGEQQRAAISRALANDPEIIIADEPTGNLDSANSEIIKNIFKKLNRKGKTIITVTHEKVYPGEYDQVVFLSDGKINERDYDLAKIN